ncbi:MAG: bifunctional hydroxymethylpyrimidine kinase/phosphomethylpyrimidine kinase [Terriglobales bacterium]
MAPPVVLTIAGFDPSSGAGVTADVKTAAAHGCYALACITALTVQSTLGVRQVEPVSGQTISDTLAELAADTGFQAVHIGMLGSAEAASRVAEFLESYRPPNVVLDPIVKASSGTPLLNPEGLEILRTRLLPLADVVTPNLDEAAALTGMDVRDLDGMRAAAEALAAIGARAVVVTGGHLEVPVDLLWYAGLEREYPAARIDSRSTHGTGCAFAMALACRMALGSTLTEAVAQAKKYVADAIRSAPGIGRGVGPLNHFPK